VRVRVMGRGRGRLRVRVRARVRVRVRWQLHAVERDGRRQPEARRDGDLVRVRVRGLGIG